MRFIDARKASYPVAMLCRLVDVSRAGYYAWCHRRPSQRAEANATLTAATIQELSEQFTAMLRQVARDLAERDLAEGERQLQAAIRPVLGQVMTAVVAARVAGQGLRPRCPTCQGRLHLVDGQRRACSTDGLSRLRSAAVADRLRNGRE